jgi:hypothetical protein
MASFTETVERHNPALVATGLAVWGWILRAVVAVSIFILPFVVSSTTTLVDHSQLGLEAQAILKKDPLVATVIAHPTLFAELGKYPTAAAIPPTLLDQAIKAVGLPKLEAIDKDPHIKAEGAFFLKNAATLQKVEAAEKASPEQWQHWFWVCAAGQVVFLPLVLVMAGRWRPRSAKRDADEHERLVQEELAQLATAGAGAGAGPGTGGIAD